MAYFVSSKNPFELKGADKTPYLFRPIPYHGNLETDKLVGGTVAFNQLVKNGNFTSDSDWVKNNATVVVDSNTAAITPTAQHGNINTKVPIFANRKILIIAEIKTTTSRTLQYGVDDNTNYTTAINISVTSSYALFSTIISIGANSNNNRSTMFIRDSNTSGFETFYVKNVMTIDLTQMFGSTIADYIYTLEQTTAGAGVAFFRELFPDTYYAYNAGQLMSVKTSAHVMTGFNQWDEEWEVGGISDTTGENVARTDRIRSKNYIQTLANTIYYARIASTSNIFICEYDANKTFIRLYYAVQNTTFITGKNTHFIRFYVQPNYGTTYNNDICINISDASKNGTYEPYKKYTYPLDGTKRVYRKYGIVVYDGSDDENWVMHGSGSAEGFAMRSSISLNINIEASPFSNYLQGISRNVTWGDFDNWVSVTAYNNIVTGVQSITTVEAWKTYLSTHPLVVIYELAEPFYETVENPELRGIFKLDSNNNLYCDGDTCDDFTNLQIVDGWGTEEYVDSRAVKIPVGHESKYYKVDFPS